MTPAQSRADAFRSLVLVLAHMAARGDAAERERLFAAWVARWA